MIKAGLFCSAILALTFAPATLQAGVLLSENFDGLSQQLGVTSAGAFTAINGTNIDIVGAASGFALCNGPESGNCVDMNGSGGNSQGQLQSTMVFGPGTYFLSFDLIGDQRGSTASVTVMFGSYNKTFTLVETDLTSGIVVNAPVTVTSPTQLLFTSGQTGDIGLLLDNVVVSTATVPEPSTDLLLGMGIVVTAIGIRRRRRV